jgi:hypothetical protein
MGRGLRAFGCGRLREVEEHDAGRPAQVDTAAFTVSAIVPTIGRISSLEGFPSGRRASRRRTKANLAFR